VPERRGGYFIIFNLYKNYIMENNREIIAFINNQPIFSNYIENLPCNIQLKSRARALRKAGVLSEVIFWLQVHKGMFWKIDFDRQRIIGNYIVDFYIKTLGLIIEIDGSSHNEKEKYDQKRDDYFISLGLKIYKISDLRVKHDLNNVMIELGKYITKEFGKKT
jgi:very-short-patch-repair endonuclease